MKEYKHSFKKRFGQNFLTDKNLLNAIADDAEVSRGTNVLEIGTGQGALTEILATKCKKLVTVEIDKDLQDFLRDKFANSNVTLVFDDILKISDSSISQWFNGEEFCIVANLPYNITTPILFKFLEGNFKLTGLTVMVQKEVALRITAKEGSKDYGALTANLLAIADSKITRFVTRKLFNPMPNVDSAIVNIKLNYNKHKIKNFSMFSKVVKCVFFSRRKTLANNMMHYFNLTREQATEILNNLNWHSLVRGESLSIGQLVELSNYLSRVNFDIKC